MLPSFFIHLRRHVQAGGTAGSCCSSFCFAGFSSAGFSPRPHGGCRQFFSWESERVSELKEIWEGISSAYCKYWEGKGAFSNIMYIGVKIEKLYLESALHGLSWKGKAYVIYLRNWTISGIACGELECITVAFKVSSLFCFDHFSLSSSPLLSSSPVLPRTSVSLCHFPNFKVSQFICCHCEVKFNCLSLEVPLMWTVIPMICNVVNSSSWIFIWLSCLHTATDLLQLNDKNSCGVPVCVTKKQSW